MNTVVIEHVELNELPAAWRAQFHMSKNIRVTVRIEEEEPEAASALASNPLFGMWQDREETADFAAYAILRPFFCAFFSNPHRYRAINGL